MQSLVAMTNLDETYVEELSFREDNFNDSLNIIFFIEEMLILWSYKYLHIYIFYLSGCFPKL